MFLFPGGSFQKKYCENTWDGPKNVTDNVPSFRYLRNSLSLNTDKIYLPLQHIKNKYDFKFLKFILSRHQIDHCHII